MARSRLGVALLLPAATAAEVDGLRRALGDPALGRIAPHLTLVPPVNISQDRIPEVLAILRSAAAATRPFALELGPPATFLPANPVLYLRVAGATEALTGLRDRALVVPLARPLTRPWVAHVTLADGGEPERLAAAAESLAGYRVTVGFERVHLLVQGAGRVWEPMADAAFAPRAVVGRGGLEVELTVTEGLDPEAAAVAAGHGRGRPFAVTARRGGRVVGVGRGATEGDHARLDLLVVEAGSRRQGIGSHLLAAVESLAAARGCSRVGVACDAGSGAEVLFRHRGWWAAPATNADEGWAQVHLVRSLR